MQVIKSLELDGSSHEISYNKLEKKVSGKRHNYYGMSGVHHYETGSSKMPGIGLYEVNSEIIFKTNKFGKIVSGKNSLGFYSFRTPLERIKAYFKGLRSNMSFEKNLDILERRL